jgi:hypothetical protein
MPTFLTVREAAQLTGKSPSSIRRVISPILQDDKHADRKHIQPSVDDAMKLRMQGENFAWKLNEDFLRRVVPIEPGPEKGTSGASSRPSSGEGELLAMLRRELDIKNQQITVQSELIGKQMELISGLGERLREGNILIGGLQQRLALTDGRDSMPAETVNAKIVTPAKEEKGSAAPPKAAKPDKPTVSPSKPAKPKKGLFSRLFR